MNTIKGEGVPDFVLLDQLTEDALLDNIRLRYKKDIVYVSSSEELKRANDPDNKPFI